MKYEFIAINKRFSRKKNKKLLCIICRNGFSNEAVEPLKRPSGYGGTATGLPLISAFMHFMSVCVVNFIIKVWLNVGVMLQNINKVKSLN